MLENQVAEAVKEKIADHAQKDVYEVYTPSIYKRNYGLKDMDNMKVNKLVDGIEVYNTTEYEGKYIPKIVETGIGYDYNEKSGFQNPPYTYQNPRPFMENTRNELDITKEHVEVLRNGLRSQGIDVK